MILFSIYMHSTSICVICQVVNRGISRMRLHFGLLSERGEWPAVVAWYMPAQVGAAFLIAFVCDGPELMEQGDLVAPVVGDQDVERGEAPDELLADAAQQPVDAAARQRRGPY